MPVPSPRSRRAAGVAALLAATLAVTAVPVSAQTPLPVDPGPPLILEGAQTTPRPGAQAITLPQALALSEEFSPRLVAARAQLQAARSGVVTAGAYPNPEVEFGVRQYRERVDGGPNGRGRSVALAQQFELPSVRAPRIRAAEFGVVSAQLAFADARLALRAAVKQAFYDVLRRKAELELALDTERLLREIRNRIEIRVNVGESARFELTRADAEFAGAANQSASARLRVTQALAALRANIAAPIAFDFDVIGTLETGAVVPTLEVLRQDVLARQPVLRAARAEVERSQARVETERALRRPAPIVRGGFVNEPQANEFGISVGLPIPVWNRREGPIGEAVAQLMQSTATFDQRRIEIIGAVDAAYARYRVATQQIAAFEGGLLRQAESALRVAEAAFRFGERGFIDVLDAQRVLRSVRLEFLNARFEQQSALVDIERLLAADLPDPETPR